MTRSQSNRYCNVREFIHKVNAIVVFKEYRRLQTILLHQSTQPNVVRLSASFEKQVQ